ncbi:MAG TPA: hypothetical protein VGQ04_10985, partial [Chitinophagaceae bacterium]|nr:hypothetical protein [Chitinophagaceae bacterium]
YITITDFILLPIYLFVVFLFASYFKNKYYPKNHPLRRYFMPAFTFKIIGAILLGIIYQYYYKGGDTFNYWHQTEIINSSMSDSFWTWLRLITGRAEIYDVDVYNYTTQFTWYGIKTPEYLISVIGALIGLFTMTTYLPTAVLFAAISFTGVWKLYIVFTKLYPRLSKQLAYAILFIPSVIFWGSGFMKDTITLSCMGWVTHFFYIIFYENKKIIANSIFALIFLYIIYIIKSYIVMAFLPAILLWGVGLLSYKIKDTRLILFVRYFLYASAIGGIFVVGGKLEAEMFGEYNVESLASKSFVTRDYLYRISNEQDGSGYTLGDFDPTVMGMLQQAPAGVNVTLFRPYLWEARKPIVMISAFESLFFLIFTIVVIFRNNPIRVIQRVLSDETLQFCLIFTLVFAFAVGISTSNFGSLVRYKIPCLPFYTAFLIILYYPPKQELVLRKERDKSRKQTV